MSKKRILFIVEGTADEEKFIGRLLSVCNKNTEFEIYSYNTNIHVLAQELYDNYPDFEDDSIDIRIVLKSIETDANKREILDQKFTDIIMVFDFEPQHDHLHFDTVKRMLYYFKDSADQGKLYLNYPMMQSYKHFSKLPEPEFCDKFVRLENVKDYKRTVGNESAFKDLTKYDYRVFFSLSVHHMMKANRILTGKYCLPEYSEYLGWNQVDVFTKQLEILSVARECFILNTSIFALTDFAPQKYFNFIEKHERELMI